MAAIVGAAAGVAVLLLCAVVIILWRRKRSQLKGQDVPLQGGAYNTPYSAIGMPSAAQDDNVSKQNFAQTLHSSSRESVDKWHIARSELNLEERIGAGGAGSRFFAALLLTCWVLRTHAAFGAVYKGEWRQMEGMLRAVRHVVAFLTCMSVAVKCIQAAEFGEKEIGEFVAEAELMMRLKPHSTRA